MRRDELRVEQHVAARTEARGQVHERDLRRIPFAVEHTFPEKGAAERDPVESPDEMP